MSTATATITLPDSLAALIDQKHWVVWRWGIKDGRKTKVPYRADSPSKKAAANDPATWNDYTTAVEAAANPANKLDGIGFVIFKSNIAAFDLDKCRNPETGVIDQWAWELLVRSNSYAEITPSGRGLRIIGFGSGPRVYRVQEVPGAGEGSHLETYRNAEKYITVTGNALPDFDKELADLDAVINETVAKLEAASAKKTTKEKTADASGGDNGVTVDVLDDIIANGCYDRFNGDRSAAVWFVINEMLRRGYRPEVIKKILLDRSREISSHIYSQDKPEAYAARQLTQALSKIDFTRNDNERIIANRPSNIRIALLKLGVTVRQDRFADRTLLDGLPGYGPTLDDDAVIHLWLLLDQRFKFQPTRDLLNVVLKDTALLNGFHPVCDYLDDVEKKWDGQPRVDKWLIDYAEAEDSPYTRAVGALMLIAAVRRVRRPGCKFDEMLVLENPEQGNERSSALAVLAVREEWFTDDLPLNVESKRVIEQLRGRWIVEAAELSGMRKTDVEHLKAFLSRQIDRARLAYERHPTEMLRQCVIFGTTNKLEYLKDPSGNRRFWPVRTKRFKLDLLRHDRDQLWAEAAARERKGESIRLDPKLWPEAEKEQQQRLADDPFVGVLDKHLGHFKDGKIRAADVWEILGLHGGQLNQDIFARTADAMREIGWERPKGRVASFKGRNEAAYIRGNRSRTIIAISDRDGLTVCYEGEDETKTAAGPAPGDEGELPY